MCEEMAESAAKRIPESLEAAAVAEIMKGFARLRSSEKIVSGITGELALILASGGPETTDHVIATAAKLAAVNNWLYKNSVHEWAFLIWARYMLKRGYNEELQGTINEVFRRIRESVNAKDGAAALAERIMGIIRAETFFLPDSAIKWVSQKPIAERVSDEIRAIMECLAKKYPEAEPFIRIEACVPDVIRNRALRRILFFKDGTVAAEGRGRSGTVTVTSEMTGEIPGGCLLGIEVPE